MHFRVTTSSFTRNAIHMTTMHSSQILRAQRQITSGLQFERPSEEPLAYRQVRSLETRYVELQADKTSITRSSSVLNSSVAQLQDMSDLVIQARTIVQRGIQAFDGDEREALATELDALLEQAKAIGLSQFNGNYLFGGTRSDKPPFEFGESIRDGGPIQATYLGSHQRSQSHVGETLSIDTYYDGAEIFGKTGRQSTLVIGETGAKPGGGTDTLAGRATLQVRHAATTYGGTSGIATGTSSAGGDTILGTLGDHQLTIVDLAGDGSSGTVSLNGAEPVAFTNADTNLEVVGRNGQVVFVDTTNITSGFNGNVNVTATGTLSVDDGATTIPIDFSTGQTVFDSVSGKFTTIDSSNIQLSGDDELEFPGTSNLFQILSSVSLDLRNTRDLQTAEYGQSLNRRLDELDQAQDKIFDAMGQQSASLQSLQNLEFRVDDLMLSVESEIGEVQATDFPDAVLRLENSQNLLQYSYAVTAQVTNLGLLEFLR